MTLGTTPITPGSGATVAVDDVGGDLYQAVKIFDGTEDGTAGAPVDVNRGLAVDTRRKWARLTVTPTFSTATYAAGDTMGGAQTIAGAVREAGAYSLLRSVTVWNKQPALTFDLWLVFTDRALVANGGAGITDQAAFAPDDDDLEFITGIVPVVAADWLDFAANSAVTYSGLAVPIRANSGTSAAAYLVAQGAIDLTTDADLAVVLHVEHF